MKPISAAVLGLMLAAGAAPVHAQMLVENEPALSPDQRAVLPLLDPLRKAVLQNNRVGLIAMLETSSKRLTIPQQRGIGTFVQRLRDSSDIYSCIVFDTACARSYFSALSDSMKNELPRESNSASFVSQVFISTREFFEKHPDDLQVTFQPQPEGTIQAELHGPRRVDADQIAMPFGIYESLTVTFIKVGPDWKINVLFPEAYEILTRFF